MSKTEKTLFEAVGGMLRHCARTNVAPNQQIEIELRTRLQAEEFFMLVHFMATARGFDFDGATAQRDWFRATSNGGVKRRTVCDVESDRPLFDVTKRTMLAERAKFIVGQFKLSVDTALETYSDATVEADDGVDGFRRKERRSFRHVDAPMWRIDMTRVVYCSHGSMAEQHGELQYEMEIEFLRDSATTLGVDDTKLAVKQLQSLLALVIGTV